MEVPLCAVNVRLLKKYDIRLKHWPKALGHLGIDPPLFTSSCKQQLQKTQAAASLRVLPGKFCCSCRKQGFSHSISSPPKESTCSEAAFTNPQCSFQTI